MPRKIALHIIQDLDVAGAQTVVMNYLRWFYNDPDVEIRVAVLGSNKHSAYSEECATSGYNVRYYDYIPWLKVPLLRTIVNWIKMNRLVAKAIKTDNPDIIHSHQTYIIPYTCLPFLFSKIKKRYHTLHSDPYAIPKQQTKWARFAFKHCGITPVCVTLQQAKKAENKYGISQYYIIRNGLDTSVYSASVEASEVKKELGITENVKVFGCVSRLSKIKNFDFLLKTFAEYHRLHQDSILLLVGDGEEKSHIIDFSKELGIYDCLLLAGQQGNVAKYYKILDVFMLTSFFESSSIVTVEAQLSGIRCVVADSIPADVVITDKVNRIPLNAPIETWVKGMEGVLPFEKNIYPSEIFTKEGIINELKKLYEI